MDTTKEKTLDSLYVHFPFCEAKCHYCDFFSLPEKQVRESERSRIYDAISRELDRFSDELAPSLGTVFLGGGTPSLVPLTELQSVLDKLRPRLRESGGTEVTMEANPSSITAERAKAWRSLGVNRISMGVQALEDERLKWLGRVHDKSEVFAALEALFEAGFARVSTDYIVGVPGQTVSMIESELDELLTRFPHVQHVSAYLLTLKTGNSKFRELPTEDEQLAHLRAVSSFLASRGFEQYEISNFAKPGARALHNENYWLGGGYLGIGPSAHSYRPGTRLRTKNWASLGKYVDLVASGRAAVEWEETLTNEQQRLEYLMLRLRRSEGVDLEEYRKLFGQDLLATHQALLEQWQKHGLCQLDAASPGRLRLTADGFFLSDQILSKIS